MFIEVLKRKFAESFNMERVAYDLLDLVDENKLTEYIKESFKNDFSYEELYNLFINEVNEEELQQLLEEMGFEFINLGGSDTNIKAKEMRILKDNFNVAFIDNNTTLELETWTDGGVDMIINLDLTESKNIEELLEEYIDNFDMDEEIELYRQDKDYKNNFTITESVKDFEDWQTFVRGIINQLKEV